MTATLQELTERVEALEQAAVADQLTPGVFNINAAGQLEEKLTGKLEALGIIFELGSRQEGSGLGPGSETRVEIEWGAAASIAAYGQFQKPPGTVKVTVLELQTLVGGFGSANLFVEVQTNPAKIARVRVSAVSERALILDSTGRSNFLQLLKETAGIASFGVISGAGASLFGTNDFTPSLIETGVYKIEWKVAKPNANYLVLATANVGSFVAITQTASVAAASFLILVHRTSNELSSPTTVAFLAIAPE